MGGALTGADTAAAVTDGCESGASQIDSAGEESAFWVEEVGLEVRRDGQLGSEGAEDAPEGADWEGEGVEAQLKVKDFDGEEATACCCFCVFASDSSCSF